jgi:hypothetical protein
VSELQEAVSAALDVTSAGFVIGVLEVALEHGHGPESAARTLRDAITKASA